MPGVLTAILLGLVSSLHCVGMCGPLMLALPAVGSKPWLNYFFYNSGRVLTYVMLGYLFGFFGESLVIHGWQQGLSIFSGLLILGVVLFPLFFSQKNQSGIYTWLNQHVVHLIAKNLRKKGWMSFPALGMLNGILPCGIVYLALISAVAEGSSVKSAVFMLFFGLGTFPALFFVQSIKKALQQTFKINVNKIIPVLATSMAVLLILRGLNLGIPYVSPKFSKSETGLENRSTSVCHKPNTK